jgi:CheY-like chemotaxis protein
MILKQLNILHAEDDIDDCVFFKEALEELNLPTSHTVVHDGEQLMQYLENRTNELPHILFLDLNMPRKNGAECLSEIKFNERLKRLTIIIFSTAFDPEVVDRLYKSGAQYYIRKPSDFTQFKKLIQQAFVSLIGQENISQPSKEKFVLSSEKNLAI